MTTGFVPFDATAPRIETAVASIDSFPARIEEIHLVRDLFGKVRISVPDDLEEDEKCHAALRELAERLSVELGVRSYPSENGVLFTKPALLETLKDTRRPIAREAIPRGRPRIYLADRLVTGQGWWTVADRRSTDRPKRVTLYSVKGGMGRSTTAAVLALHLARNGERVLVVDLDLESPGLSSAMLEPGRQPEFGVTDWFVEDLVGQGDCVVEDMLAAPAWTQDLEGDVRVAPAHGREAGEYLSKLGRVYMDRRDDPWTNRLRRLLGDLEASFAPTITIVEARSGLHDIAAATVTDLDAEILLFATDSESTWSDYRIIFDNWKTNEKFLGIRNRFFIVSAFTPTWDNDYLNRFYENAWKLFQEIYDELGSSIETEDEFAFALEDEFAPHRGPAIYWERGLSAGASLRNMGESTVRLAYGDFLAAFPRIANVIEGGET